MENQPREAKKKTKGRGLQPSRGGSSGSSAQPQPPFGYTSQPPFFFPTTFTPLVLQHPTTQFRLFSKYVINGRSSSIPRLRPICFSCPTSSIYTRKSYNYDRDMKTFLKPHDDAPPSMLPFILARKREIANKYGWPCDF
ncbi:hypothetical protein Hanom_Chr15g01414981 [Helianthus anomalus]